MQEYVLGFMFDENLDYVALIEKQNPEWQRGKLNGIGGKVEIGETPFDAMVREFEEETGVLSYNWIYSLTMYEENEFNVYVYYAFDDSIHDVRTVEKETVRIFDVDFDFCEIKAKSISNVPWLIMMGLDDDVISGNVNINCKYR